jgi:hypothetical protein
MDNYTIYRLEKENFDSLIPLMQDCFGMEVDIHYFKWKYLDNPDGFVRGYIAKSSTNEIAAYYGVIPQMISFFGEDKLIYQSCDTMTHSKHRRKGLFQQLAKHCYSELKKENQLFIIGFGGSESTPGFLKFGWKHLFNCKNYFYPAIFSSLNIVNLEERINNLEIERLEQIQHLISPKNANDLSTIRTFEKYSWRIKNPLHTYKIKTFSSKDKIITSFIIYYLEQNKIQLIDYAFKSIKEGRQLINHIIQQEKKSFPIKGILAFCQDDGTWCQPLKKIGFISNPFSKGPLSYKTPFITFTDSNNSNEINNPKYWNISPFDHDSL